MSKGIYKITNIVNNKIYVGSSNDLSYRKSMHFSGLKCNKHFNQHLQNSYNKHGKDSFVFEIIEECQDCENIKELLLSREQYYFDTLLPQYNILSTAGSTLGFIHSEETKLKISNTTKGVKKSKEHCEAMKGCQIGKIVSEETKQKLKDYAKIRPVPAHTSEIIIDDIKYSSLTEASEKLELKYGTIQKRLANPNFINYNYVSGKIAKPRKDTVKGLSFRNKAVIIDGVIYESAIKASKILNLKGDTVKYRISSDNFSNYKFK